MPDVEKIRSLFLAPKPTYSLAEAATLLGMESGDVRGWVETGELEGVDTYDVLSIPWSELISFGMDFWSQEVVEEALGADSAEAIPELLRLTDLAVRIPRLEVVALERMAASDGKSCRHGARAGVAGFRVGKLVVAESGSSWVPHGPGLAGRE